MVALIASSMAGGSDLRTERAGVLSLVIGLMLWLVVNSIVANKRLLDCRVDSVSDAEVFGIVWE